MECKLELHPIKTKIVYCKDDDRREEKENTQFDFLGYTFKGIFIKNKLGKVKQNFLASVSKGACQSLKQKIKSLEIHKNRASKIEIIAEMNCPQKVRQTF